MEQIIKLLQETKLPVWTLLIILILGWIIIKILDLKVAKYKMKYEHQLKREDEIRASLQRKFDRKLEVIEEIEKAIWEFNHEFEFNVIGHGLPQNFNAYYYELRKLGRNSISIIGKEGEKYSDIIRQLTDIGKGLIDAKFKVTEESIWRLEREPQVPNEIVNILRKKIGQPASKLSDLLEEVESPWLYSKFFFEAVEPTSGFTLKDYYDQKNKVFDFNKQACRELPSVND